MFYISFVELPSRECPKRKDQRLRLSPPVSHKYCDRVVHRDLHWTLCSHRIGRIKFLLCIILYVRKERCLGSKFELWLCLASVTRPNHLNFSSHLPPSSKLKKLRHELGASSWEAFRVFIIFYPSLRALSKTVQTQPKPSLWRCGSRVRTDYVRITMLSRN